MTVAWIGNRVVRLEEAVAEAAAQLVASRCPVISMETDVHGARMAVALADRIGAAIDLANGAATLREATQLTDRGMMTVAPGEVRRRADLLVLIGDMPRSHTALIDELVAAKPDLATGQRRVVFSIGGKQAGMTLPAEKGSVATTLARLRAVLKGRQVGRPASKLDALVRALNDAAFPVFVWSGLSGDMLALDMLQGLVADLNKDKRASTLHLPANEAHWGAVLACGWSSGFPSRVGFALGRPEHDPWRFDAARMTAHNEADLVIAIGERTPRDRRLASSRQSLIVLAPVTKAVPGAKVTLATGRPGIDHDTVTYRSKLGTLGAIRAAAPSAVPSAAAVLRQVIELLDKGAT